MAAFPRIPVGDLIAAGEAELKTGPFGTQLKASEYTEEGTTVINVRNIGMGSIKADKLEFISDATRDRLSSHLLRSGDIVFGRKGAVERHVFIRKEQDGWFQGSDCLRLRFNSPRVLPLFASYFFITEEHQRWMMNQCSHGATMSSLNQDILERIDLPLPPMPVQRRIAGILSAYDELMENGQRRIRLLEAMARALYRECIREAGESASAKGILETDCWTFISANVSPYSGTKRYYATADIEGLAIHGAGIDYTFAEKPSRAQKQPTPFSVWFARMKDTYKIAWYSDVNSQSAYSSVLSSGFAGFQPVEPLYFPLLFLTVSSKDFHAQKDLFCTGATQMSLTNEGLSRIEVPAPSKQAARQLGEQALPLLNQMLVLQLRIQNLRRTRDLLLPRLLSGRVHQIKTEP